MFAQLNSAGSLPDLEKYPVVDWLTKRHSDFQYVYATGGQKQESHYALRKLGIVEYFDLEHSIDKTSCACGKKTGIPFKKIMKTHPDCIFFTDSISDCAGASKAGVPTLLVQTALQQLSLLAEMY